MKVSHYQWNGLQYYPSNTTPRVQKGLGNILFPENQEKPILLNMLPNSPLQINNIKVNPDFSPPKKDGKWTIKYLNSSPIPYPELEFIDPSVNWDKRLVLKLFYSPSKIEMISSLDKAKYYFYVFNNGLGDWFRTPNHILVWWDISSILSFKDPNGNPFINTPFGDPDIDNYLPIHKYCVQKIPLPPNLDN